MPESNKLQGELQSVLHPIIGPKKEITDLTGRTAVITGGALGIGFEISRHFALNGCKVIMLNRKEEQGQEAIEKIKNEKADAQVEWRPIDLGSLNEVKKVGDELRESLDRLDLLICSAGINTNSFGLDADGYDRHFGVNWLGHFYLINLLYPVLRKTSKIPDAPAPRIVFEASEVHRMAPPDVHYGSFEEINDERTGPTHLYARTKLAMILGAKFILKERVIEKNGDHIYALSVHPGTVNTDMQEQWKNAYPGWFGTIVARAMQAVGRSPEQGSFSALYAATSPEIEEKGWNGYYFADPASPGKESSQASDRNLANALYDLSTRMIKEKVGQDALLSWDA